MTNIIESFQSSETFKTYISLLPFIPPETYSSEDLDKRFRNEISVELCYIGARD
jgi:hypothetical protein